MTHTTPLWSFSELLSKLKALNRHLFKLLSVSSVNHGVAQWDIYPHDQNDRLRTSKHPTFSRVTDSSMVLTDAKIATNNRLLERGALTGRLFLGLIMYMPTKKTQHWAKRYHILYSGIWNGMNGSSSCSLLSTLTHLEESFWAKYSSHSSETWNLWRSVLNPNFLEM